MENDVVTKIEGYPKSPTSMGSICMKCMNQIHTAYSPRRVLYPIKRVSERGAENAEWARITWDEALDLAGTQIADSIEKYGTYSFFTSCGGGGNYSITHAQATAYTMGSPTFFEPGCAQCWLPRVETAALMYGQNDDSLADCCVLEPFKGLYKANALNRGWEVDEDLDIDSDTKAIVLWGTQPSVSQTAESGRGMAELRALGCKTVVVDPNMSPDAAKATVWLRVRPGSDAALVSAWFR
ncbi:MAG: molybdopterin-dependent oxidoreductase [Eggerthellaceae bacterium]|nr:molybdopterin-dependent oxidoreductase [Eggerthellaceae bacterium]